MFDLILDAVPFSAILILAVSFESFSPSFPTYFRKHLNCASIVSRYFAVAVMLFPEIIFAMLRAAEKALLTRLDQ